MCPCQPLTLQLRVNERKKKKKSLSQVIPLLALRKLSEFTDLGGNKIFYCSLPESFHAECIRPQCLIMGPVPPGVVQCPTYTKVATLTVLPKAGSQTDIFRKECLATSNTQKSDHPVSQPLALLLRWVFFCERRQVCLMPHRDPPRP